MILENLLGPNKILLYMTNCTFRDAV